MAKGPLNHSFLNCLLLQLCFYYSNSPVTSRFHSPNEVSQAWSAGTRSPEAEMNRHVDPGIIPHHSYEVRVHPESFPRSEDAHYQTNQDPPSGLPPTREFEESIYGPGYADHQANQALTSGLPSSQELEDSMYGQAYADNHTNPVSLPSSQELEDSMYGQAYADSHTNPVSLPSSQDFEDLIYKPPYPKNQYEWAAAAEYHPVTRVPPPSSSAPRQQESRPSTRSLRFNKSQKRKYG